jgi:DNA-binding response OmpR family regulator
MISFVVCCENSDTMNTKGTILVVDDTPVNLKLLVGTLTANGYQVLPADSGELALASVEARLPELILLDICMPGLDGFEVCRRLRARAESRDIPVMFISATRESAERVEGLRLGAVDFITKPLQREELLARVQTHLELRRLRVRLEQQADGLRQVNEQLQTELAERKRTEVERDQLIRDLQSALANVKSLSGLLPICAGCKKIRDDKGYWSQVESYVQKHSEAKFSHGMCPDCLKKWYPELDLCALADPTKGT